MSAQHARPTRLDGFEVVHADKTPGEVMYKQNRRLTLHNAEEPCGSVANIKHPRTQRLGADIPPRPEARRFCDSCDWPADEETLYRAMTTIPEAFR